MNVSIHDALQTTLTSKFIYGLVASGDRDPSGGYRPQPRDRPDPGWSR